MTSSAATDETTLEDVRTLAEFRETVGRLTTEERDQIILQAIVLIDQLYVHLPLKRAMHAVDPVQRLRVLRRRAATAAGGLSDRQFHAEMIGIFTGLRDLHTRYILPAAYRGWTALLPFRVREFVEDGQPRYVVTQIVRALIPDPGVREGLLVVRWNGVSMDRAVELNADRQAGSNRDARHARGVNTMTKRPLETSAMPDEDWVYVGYVGEDGQEHEARVEWCVLKPERAPTTVDPSAPDEPLALALGLDLETEAVRRSRTTLFHPDTIRDEKKMATLADIERHESSGALPGLGGASVFPDALQFCTRSSPRGEFGYLRIRTFLVREVRLFVAEVIRILDLLPRRGLIVDVRGNPGGVIMNGELLLQLFTPRRVEPERLHFLNTPLTRELCERVGDLTNWKDSIAESVETATTFSDGFPMTSEQDCNALGQHYHGPTVLITDALCYSATDIFAAGWRDHGIGPILGTSRNTGAGGANVWEHADLVRCFKGAESPIKPLPQDASFSVAIRRTTRVGERSGDPLEDLGVVPDHEHQLTRADILGNKQDLLDRAEQILLAEPLRALAAEATRNPDGRTARMKVTAAGMDRLDTYVDERPRQTLDVSDGDVTFDVPTGRAPSPLVELRGFDAGDLVATRRLRL